MTTEQFDYLINKYPEDWRKGYNIVWSSDVVEDVENDDLSVGLLILDKFRETDKCDGYSIVLQKASNDMNYLESLIRQFFELEKPEYIIQDVTEEDGVSTVIVEKNYGAFCKLFKYHEEDLLYINWLGVPTYNRSKQLGDTLMRIVNDIAENRGISRLKLAVIKGSWKHEWYEKLGFIDIEEDLGNDEYVWMEKCLTDKKD